MEPGQDTQEPRRKGFWRRNWLALAYAGLLMPFAFYNTRLSPAIGDTEYDLGSQDGHLVFWYLQHPGRSYGFCKSVIERCDWNGFSLGVSSHYMRDAGTMGVAIPIWMPLAILAAWIAFREWRRKRAAKGKPCHQ